MKDIYKAFGMLLRDLRNGVGVTQEQLADRVGMKRTTITNIEQGTQSVSLQQVYELANGLGLEPAELLPNYSIGPAKDMMRNLVTGEGNVRLVLKMIGGNQNATHRGEGSRLARTGRSKKSTR